MSIMNWLSIFFLIVSVFLCGLAVYVWWQSRRYTRERFAFTGLASVTSLAMIAVVAFSGVTPWDAALSVFIYFTTGQPPSAASSTEGKILTVILIGLVISLVVRLHRNWGGLITAEQAEKAWIDPNPSLLREGVEELRRILAGAPAAPVYQPGRSKEGASPLELLSTPTPFRDLVREAFCLHWPDTIIDPEHDWHQRGRCWAGSDRRTQRKVVLLCPGDELDEPKQEEIFLYFESLPELDREQCDIFHIQRRPMEARFTDRTGWTIKTLSLDDLLDELIDLSDYREAIRQRVEDTELPNSELTISQTYTPARVRVEGVGDEAHDLSEYLTAWLQSGEQRHLALLGEYGQGKSTSALMLAYRLLCQDKPPPRVPILVELRGKSPKNQTPLGIIGDWASNYNLSARGLMILHRAGRLLFIFEGFDEMDGLGEQSARHAHFSSLWRFASAPRAKLLFTGRPELFLDDHELRRALGVHPDVATGPYTQLLWLSRFDNSQIQDALRSYPAQIRNEICDLSERNATFMDIVSRPSLLQQVSTIWNHPELQKHKSSINSGLVIKLFLDSSYRRQSEKMRADSTFRFMRLHQSELAFFTRGVAVSMALMESPNQITGANLYVAVDKIWKQIPDDCKFPAHPQVGEEDRPLKSRMRNIDDPLETIVTNVRSYGVLVRDYAGPDLLKFAHKSYFELLTAQHAMDLLLDVQNLELSILKRTFPGRLEDTLVSPVAIRLFGDLFAASRAWASDEKRRMDVLYDAVFRRGYARFVPRILHLFLAFKLPAQIVSPITDMVGMNMIGFGFMLTRQEQLYKPELQRLLGDKRYRSVVSVLATTVDTMMTVLVFLLPFPILIAITFFEEKTFGTQITGSIGLFFALVCMVFWKLNVTERGKELFANLAAVLAEDHVISACYRLRTAAYLAMLHVKSRLYFSRH